MSNPRTLGELRSAGYANRSVKDEIRDNLILKIQKAEPLFPGVIGYGDTVVPHIINALLAKQNFILLGLRGQAKSRILRELTSLLDERIPALQGSEVNDDPFAPISRFGKRQVEELGDATPITWIARQNRYVEKLATPDVTISDLIGDVDPIKAAKGGHLLSDELTIHYGLLPRSNRGIFAINELPDLAGKIQVGLFNVLQEGDIQIKGYPVRLLLDVLLVFSANPEDYTARGKIITPLKDRIGAEIRTHYPKRVEDGMDITRQEAFLERKWPGQQPKLILVPIINEVVEYVAFLARDDRRIDKRSGVSQRLTISLLEAVLSNAERRALISKENVIVPRISDLYASLTTIVGKIELEYEGEQIGAERIAIDLIRRACAAVFERRLDSIEIKDVVDLFNSGTSLTIGEFVSIKDLLAQFRGLKGLVEAASCAHLDEVSDEGLVVASELILEALHAQKRLARTDRIDGATYVKSREEKPRKGQQADERFN